MTQATLLAPRQADVPPAIRAAAEHALEATSHLDLATALTAVSQAAPGWWPELIEGRSGRRIYWPARRLS